MAYKNKLIHNPKTGQSIRFLQTAKDTDGALLEMESTFDNHSKEPAPHYHPYQQEDFTVLEGELTVRLPHELRILKAGETIHIDRNVVHSMWNNSGKKTVMNWKVQPAMETEYFLENAMGLAVEGRTNAEGMPGLLQVALLASRFSSIFRLVKPPYPLQKMLFTILTPIAYIKGLKPVYQKYLN